MNEWLQKPWGYTRCLYSNQAFEFWDAHVIAGGYSSRHFHDLKWNRLASRDAVLLVRLWDDVGERQVIVGFGEFIDIAPGISHRFEVVQSGRLWESYWGRCDPQDIVRVDANGWRPPRAGWAA